MQLGYFFRACCYLIGKLHLLLSDEVMWFEVLYTHDKYLTRMSYCQPGCIIPRNDLV
jgi:hypothetical protein